MNKKTKTFTYYLPVEKPWGTYTVMIYGELYQSTEVDGIAIIQGNYSRDGRHFISVKPGSKVIDVTTGTPYLKTKSFNMGWAICSPEDKFDEERGIELCKRRFHRKPLTTQSGTFLTHDMIHAIMENEAKYIEKHFDEYVPNVKKCESGKLEEGCLGPKGDPDPAGAPIEEMLRPNMYVMLKSKNGVNSGLIHSVDGKKVHFYFITGHDGPFKKFLRYDSSGGLTVDAKFIRGIATAAETARELDILAKNHNVRWDAEKKTLVRLKLMGRSYDSEK